MRGFLAVAAMAANLFLAACYVSDKPFIAPAEADKPWPATATYVSYDLKDNVWTPGKRGTVSFKAGVYTMLDDGSDIPDYETYKSIGGGLYVVQTYISPSDVAVSKMDVSTDEGKQAMDIIKGMAGQYFYWLVRIAGGTSYGFEIGCEEGDAKYLRAGLLARIDQDNHKCYPKDFAALVRILRDKQTGAKQDSKTVITATP